MILREQPKQFLSESEKNVEWYKNNIRFIVSHFNKRNDRLNKQRKTDDLENPVDDMIRMFTYYLGKQYNKDYYYTTQDQNNCDLPSVWINGQKITSLIDYMVGNAIKMIENIEPSVKNNSKAAVNKKTELLEKLILKFEVPSLFKLMEEAGVDYEPAGPQEFEIKEDVFRYMEYDYKERAEVLAQRICEDILNRNNSDEKYKQAFLYLLLGGMVGIQNHIENGKQKFEVILPYNLIIDRGKDSDFLDDSRFVGKIDWMTPTEIIEKFQDSLSDEEIGEIKEINHNNLYQLLDLTTHPESITWAWTNNSVPVLAVATGYWIGTKDLRYEKTKDKYGNRHYARMRKNKKGYHWTQTIYKGTLIGNKYLVDFGEDSNQVRDMDNLSDVQLPIHVFMPNMVMGENRSVVQRLHQHQDRIDFITNEITKIMTRAKGKVYLINRQKLGTSTPQDVISDFERMGMHITDGSATGEDFVPGSENRLVETVDMTIDPNVQQLISLRREEERIMEEIVNIPKIALGQQSGYVGAKTQAGTIAQSNLGTTYLYKGFINFVEKQLSHALNQYKVSLIDEPDNEIPVVGKRGKNYLKLIEGFQFEELGVYLKIRDFIDDQVRERMILNAQAAMQNGMIDMIDYLKIENSKSFTELINELEYSINKKNRDRAKQEQLMQIQQQAMAEQQMAQQQQLEGMKQEGQNYRKELDNTTKAAISDSQQEQGNLE